MLVKVAKILVKLSGGDYNVLSNIVKSNDIDSFYEFFKNDDFINEYGTISNREINYLFNNFYDASKLMHEYYEKRSKGIDGKKIYLKTPKDFTAKKSNAYNGDIKNRIKNFIIERCGENYKIVKGDMLDFICDDDRFYSQLVDNNDRINNPINGKCYIGAKYDNMSLVMECDEETYPIKCYMSSLTYKILKNDYNKINESKNMSKKMTDKILLEGLVNKYGKAKITSAINKINENVNGEEYKDLILDILDSEDFGNHIDKNSNYENTHNYGNTWTEEYLTIEEDYIKDNFRFVFPEMKVRYKWCRNRWGREYCDGVSSIKIWTSGMQIYINNEKIKLSRPLITEISKKLKEWIY